MRVIRLGCGRTIGLGAYVRAWKTCLVLGPNTPIGRGVDGWGQSAGEALRDLRKGLDDRINRHLPWYGKGRKWDHDWWCSMRRAANELNHPRLVIRWLPADLMKVPRFRERVEEGRAT
jgi:hypothetical protein